MFAQVPTPVSLSLHSKRLCCSVLQCVAVCDIVLQCVASGTHTSLALLTLQESVLQCVAVCCSVLQCDLSGAHTNLALLTLRECGAAELLKSQLATQFTLYYNCRADF